VRRQPEPENHKSDITPLVPDGASAVTGMYVREGVGNLEGGRRGAEPPASGPRSGNFCRFETLEGHFPSQN